MKKQAILELLNEYPDEVDAAKLIEDLYNRNWTAPRFPPREGYPSSEFVKAAGICVIQLTDQPIDGSAVLGSITARVAGAGAVVLFLGITREITEGRRTERLFYECYREMTESKLRELDDQARKRWPIIDSTIVHRLGLVPAGEASVAIAVSSAHRQPAFEAGKWLIDTLKQVVPIWKCEHWADGTTEWVHPGSTP